MTETGQAKSSTNLVKARRRSTGENNGLTIITNDKNGGEPKEQADELAQIKLAFSSTPALTQAFANGRKRRMMTATHRSALNNPSNDHALTRFTNNDNLNVTSAEDFLGDQGGAEAAFEDLNVRDIDSLQLQSKPAYARPNTSGNPGGRRNLAQRRFTEQQQIETAELEMQRTLSTSFASPQKYHQMMNAQH